MITVAQARDTSDRVFLFYFHAASRHMRGAVEEFGE